LCALQHEQIFLNASQVRGLLPHDLRLLPARRKVLATQIIRHAEIAPDDIHDKNGQFLPALQQKAFRDRRPAKKWQTTLGRCRPSRQVKIETASWRVGADGT